jgi:hypothetical protein
VLLLQSHLRVSFNVPCSLISSYWYPSDAKLVQDNDPSYPKINDKMYVLLADMTHFNPVCILTRLVCGADGVCRYSTTIRWRS